MVCELPEGDDLDAALAAFEQTWQRQPVLHLFLTAGRDEGPRDLADDAAWQQRRYRNLLLPVFLSQRWLQLAGQAKLIDQCTLVAATSLGGDCGFSGRVETPEGGAVAGLLKSIYLEIAVLRQHKGLLIKAIDAPADEPPEMLARSILRELGARRTDCEVAYSAGRRASPWPCPPRHPSARTRRCAAAPPGW